MINTLILENWILRIKFNNDYFLNFIRKNKVANLFFNKLDFKNWNDFTFNLMNLEEINQEKDIETWDYLKKFAIDKDFIQKEKMIYLWNEVDRRMWFLFFPFFKTKNDFLKILSDSNISNKEIESFHSVFDLYWVKWVWIGIELN